MASVFGHIVASTALGRSFFPRRADAGVLLLGAISAFLPDADVLAFHFGIPYESVWGHRGWTHSAAFALAWGWLVACLFYRRQPGFQALGWYFTLATLSHPLLDMCTNGGRGVALFFPFDNERLFFPWRPILVSPLGVSNFFSPWGRRVLESECVYVLVPGVLLWALSKAFRKAF